MNGEKVRCNKRVILAVRTRGVDKIGAEGVEFEGFSLSE